MSTTFVLATPDTQLAAAWEAQIPEGRHVVHVSAPERNGVAYGLSAVVILDSTVEGDVPDELAACPTIYVGQPRSLPFEQARLAGRARVYLGYEESARRLREFLPLLEELAAKESMLALAKEKSRRGESNAPFAASAPASPPMSDSLEMLDFLEGAVEAIESRDRLLGEFRRASRYLLRASHAIFFLKDTDGFRADRGTHCFPFNDPLVQYFEKHPVVIESTSWEGAEDPKAELAVRNRLMMWQARLLVPIHDNGKLLGLIAMGVRDDGRAFCESDRVRAIAVARLLRQCVAKAANLSRLHQLAQQTTLGAKYLPSTLILGPDEAPSRQVPLVVRDLIGQARLNHDICTAKPCEGQPFRARAGIVAETGGVWACWEEASAELHEAGSRSRAERNGLLREVALTLSHELSNALVSLATYRQAPEGSTMPAPLMMTVKTDIAKLETLAQQLGIMQGLSEISPVEVDMRALVQSIGQRLGIRAELSPEPVILQASGRLLESSITSLIETIAENRPDFGNRDLTIQLRCTGSGRDATALISIRGKSLELEGILPEPMEDAVPNHGRLGVLLAKEIIRLHHGEMHAGPGLEGTEILISFRSL
jgi:hypothetical protein